MALPSREEMLKRVRQKQDERSKNRRDPFEFRIPQVKDDKETSELDYYFYVLPELQVGETCHGGQVCNTPSDMWYYENGHHFWDNAVYECPRSHDKQTCPLCDLGFELMKDSDDKEYKSKISKKYLSRTGFAINVYFPAEGEHPYAKKNPEALRGKVMWYNIGKTIWQMMDQCITSDDPGDEVKGPKACGIFYHPWECSYMFNAHANMKNKYNNYEKSTFIVSRDGKIRPLIVTRNEKGQELIDESGVFLPDAERIQTILDQRHVLQGKFGPRSVEKITALVEKLASHEQGQEAETIEQEPVKATPAARPAGMRPAPRTAATVAVRQAPAQVAPVEVEAEAQQEFAEQQVVVEETVLEEGSVVVEAEAPVEEAAPVVARPAPKAAAPVKATTAVVARPAAPVAKPVAAAKPAAPVKAAVARPAAAPSPAAAVGGDDPELAALLGAIKAKKQV